MLFHGTRQFDCLILFVFVVFMLSNWFSSEETNPWSSWMFSQQRTFLGKRNSLQSMGDQATMAFIDANFLFWDTWLMRYWLLGSAMMDFQRCVPSWSYWSKVRCSGNMNLLQNVLSFFNPQTSLCAKMIPLILFSGLQSFSKGTAEWRSHRPWKSAACATKRDVATWHRSQHVQVPWSLSPNLDGCPWWTWEVLGLQSGPCKWLGHSRTGNLISLN